MRQNQSEMTVGRETLPRPDDDSPLSAQQLAALLRNVIIVLLAGAIVALITLRVAALDQTMRLAGPMLMVLLAVTGWHLLVRGRIQAAVNILVYGAWASVTGVVIFTDGVDSPAVIAYPLIILMTGWLISSRSAIVVTGLTVGATVGYVLAESWGLLPTLLPTTALIRSGDQGIIYVLSGALIVYLVRVYKDRRMELRKASRDLANRTLDLEMRTAELHRAQAVGKIGSWVFDPASNTTHLSAETCRIFGLPEGATESRDTYLARVHPDDRDAVDRAWQALFRGDAYDNEHRIVDGAATRWIRQQAELEFANDGTPLRAVGISQDITERKHIQVALQESEERYRTMIEWMPEAIAVHREGRLLYVNPAAVKMIGAKAAQDLEGKSILDFVHPDFHQISLARANGQRDGGVAASMNEEKWLTLDGTAIDVEVYAASIVYDGAKAVQVAAHDVTERKRAEKWLRAAEEPFRALLEQPIAGIYIIQDGKFVYVNPRFAEIRGFDSADELIGRDPVALIAESDRKTVTENNHRLLMGEVPNISFTFTALRKDGSAVEVGVSSAAPTYHGRPAIIGMMQDITEKKRADDQISHYVAQLESAFMSTVEVATTLGELRDAYTAGHQRRVAEVAMAIGAELGFDGRRREGLRVAGYLHDIGKITVPAEILAKPGKLRPVELQLIQGHAQAGYSVLKDIEFPWPVAEAALQHHERMDGSGYPQGLKGEAILLEARILAVADVVEAMSSHRPYRPGHGIEAALAEIERGRGTAYDPVVADACLKLFREKGYAIPA